jgi:hypothetical protein
VAHDSPPHHLIADWWRRQDPTREPRFDFTALRGCVSRFGQLDITLVRTVQPAAAYASPDGRFRADPLSGPRPHGPLPPLTHAAVYPASTSAA